MRKVLFILFVFAITSGIQAQSKLVQEDLLGTWDQYKQWCYNDSVYAARDTAIHENHYTKDGTTFWVFNKRDPETGRLMNYVDQAGSEYKCYVKEHYITKWWHKTPGNFEHFMNWLENK